MFVGQSKGTRIIACRCFPSLLSSPLSAFINSLVQFFHFRLKQPPLCPSKRFLHPTYSHLIIFFALLANCYTNKNSSFQYIQLLTSHSHTIMKFAFHTDDTIYVFNGDEESHKHCKHMQNKNVLMRKVLHIITCHQAESAAKREEAALEHHRILNWLSRLSYDQKREVYTISSPQRVQRVLRKLDQFGQNAGLKRTDGKFEYSHPTRSKLPLQADCFSNFKIAWTSMPVIYIEPKPAMAWLRKTLKSNFFSKSTEEPELCNRHFWPKRDVQQCAFELQLATSLKNQIINKYQSGRIPSKMEEIAKIWQYTILKDVNNHMTIKRTFECPLSDCVHNIIEKHKRIGAVFQDEYYAHMERQALNLLDKEEKVKPSKRARRNQKKAQLLKDQKLQQQLLHLSQVSTIPINPEENSLNNSIVDISIYKIREQEDDLNPITKKRKNTESHQSEMYSNFYDMQETSEQNAFSNSYQEGSTLPNSPREENHKGVKKATRQNRKKYEEKKPIKYREKEEERLSDGLEESKKAALKVVTNIFDRKYNLIKEGNELHEQMKQNTYNVLLQHLAYRLPFYSIALFGSMAAGVSLPTSDIDILLTPFEDQYISETLLYDLAYDLSQTPWACHCIAIPTAKIPVIKLIADPFVSYENPISRFKMMPHEQQLQMPFLTKFDITFNINGTQNTGILATAYMQNILSSEPKLIEVMTIIKYILETAKLNEGYKGGISSYNSFIMLIAFIQEKQVDVEQTSIGEIILNFFKFFTSEFDPKTMVLRFQKNKKSVLTFQEYMKLPNSEHHNKSGLLKILDPINGKLVRASFSRYEQAMNLFRQFVDVFNLIEGKALDIAQSLVGKGKRKSVDNVVVIEGELGNSECAKWFLSLLN